MSHALTKRSAYVTARPFGLTPVRRSRGCGEGQRSVLQFVEPVEFGLQRGPPLLRRPRTRIWPMSSAAIARFCRPERCRSAMSGRSSSESDWTPLIGSNQVLRLGVDRLPALVRAQGTGGIFAEGPPAMPVYHCPHSHPSAIRRTLRRVSRPPSRRIIARSRPTSDVGEESVSGGRRGVHRRRVQVAVRPRGEPGRQDLVRLGLCALPFDLDPCGRVDAGAPGRTKTAEAVVGGDDGGSFMSPSAH